MQPCVFANGCFDHLHEGHLGLLRKCRDLAKSINGRVVIALNSDSSIERLKGHRPAHRFIDRKNKLLETGLVDWISEIDNEIHLVVLLEQYAPRYVVKGEEYRHCKITGADKLKELGSEIAYVPNVTSSTKKIDQAPIAKTRTKIVPKGWGRELWLVNTSRYCAKILQFDVGGRSSMHYHANKDETWYVKSGKFELTAIDTETARQIQFVLVPGDVVRIKPLQPHSVLCVEEGEIFEASTTHEDSDSYRVIPGDSQKV